MSFVKMYLHLVLVTKHRQPFIKQELEQKIFSILVAAFNEMKCHVLVINGTEDHVHLLCRIPALKPLSEIVKYVKGSSSHTINHYEITPERFSWSKGYAGFSVGESSVDKVAAYIRKQKEHHKVESGVAEYRKLLVAHGFVTRSDSA